LWEIKTKMRERTPEGEAVRRKKQGGDLGNTQRKIMGGKKKKKITKKVHKENGGSFWVLFPLSKKKKNGKAGAVKVRAEEEANQNPHLCARMGGPSKRNHHYLVGTKKNQPPLDILKRA